MTTSTMVPPRSASPAILSVGFRPFFLFGALFGAVMVALWVPWFLGLIAVPSAFPPTAWHAHELLFGFVPAIVAGFLLTAVPNWTGRPPVAGFALLGLFLLWLSGRVALALSMKLDAGTTAALSIAFPLVLAAVIGREIVAAGNRRNLKVVAVLLGLAAADGWFHYEIWQFGRPRHAQFVAVALVVLLLMIVAGRIVPMFTANWLKQRQGGPFPPSFNRLDGAVVLLSGAALLAWVLAVAFDGGPLGRNLCGATMVVAAGANVLRQARWQAHRTLAEPLLTILHIAYLFVALGFLLGGLGVLWDDDAYVTAGLHAWTVGAIGTMMLAVMTRVSRGHTGRALMAPPGTVVLYLLILIAAGARIAVGLHPEATLALMPVAGFAWVAAFVGFALLYGPMLMRPRLK